jgi:hypothetical protein
MIRVQMSEHYLAHVPGRNPHGTKLHTDLFIRMHREANGSLIKRVPLRMVTSLMNARRLSCVNQD